MWIIFLCVVQRIIQQYSGHMTAVICMMSNRYIEVVQFEIQKVYRILNEVLVQRVEWFREVNSY